MQDPRFIYHLSSVLDIRIVIDTATKEDLSDSCVKSFDQL